jgi:phenylacetaldehyde dehydrogenase
MSQVRPSAHPPRPQVDLIEGKWREPSVTLPATLDDPNTGVPLQQQAETAEHDVDRAISAAAELHDSEAWSATPPQVRGLLLELIADGLAHRADELGLEDALATGNPRRVATRMATFLAPRVRSAGHQLFELGESTTLPAEGRTVRLLRRPVGPAAVLAPWNAPTFVAVAKVASALAAGCPVILKPSEWAPAGCEIVAEVIAGALEQLELPSAAFQLVHGGARAGSQLAGDARIRAVSFTGGAAGGRAVAQAAAPHFASLQLELGGHNPVIVLPDADVAATGAALAEGMTKLNGQWCEAPGKILVPAKLHDDLIDALMASLGKLTIGHCLDDDTDVGPIAHRSHREHLQGRIDTLAAKGGRALTTNALPELDGWFMAPTVVDGLDAVDSEQELFGPAVTVHVVESTDHALRAATGPETGLAGFVFGGNLELALATAARLPAGEVRVNGCKLADLADGSEQTFWNGAGIGGHGPTDMVHFFQGRRTVGVDDPGLAL